VGDGGEERALIGELLVDPGGGLVERVGDDASFVVVTAGESLATLEASAADFARDFCDGDEGLRQFVSDDAGGGPHRHERDAESEKEAPRLWQERTGRADFGAAEADAGFGIEHADLDCFALAGAASGLELLASDAIKRDADFEVGCDSFDECVAPEGLVPDGGELAAREAARSLDVVSPAAAGTEDLHHAGEDATGEDDRDAEGDEDLPLDAEEKCVVDPPSRVVAPVVMMAPKPHAPSSFTRT
jgi:hypothetical protein